MKRNIAGPGRTHLMRRGDFVNWRDEVESSERLSEFLVRLPAKEIPEVVTHVRNFDHSGLRVECDDTEIRVHGLAGSFQILELALQAAERLQTSRQRLVHVDVRISQPHDVSRPEACFTEVPDLFGCGRESADRKRQFVV